MKKLAVLALALTFAMAARAQDLVITNARILDGTGLSIDRGSIVIEDGRIVSVAAGTATAARRADRRRGRKDRSAGFHRRAPPHHAAATTRPGSAKNRSRACRSSSTRVSRR